MIKNLFKRKFFTRKHLKGSFGRKSFLVVFLITFLLGYNIKVSSDKQCSALVPPTPFFCSQGCNPSAASIPCETLGETAKASAKVLKHLTNALIDMAQKDVVGSATLYGFENYVAGTKDTLVAEVLTRIDQMETAIINWWAGMWAKSLYPALQDITLQLGTGSAGNQLTSTMTLDAVEQNKTKKEIEKRAIKTHQKTTPSDCGCVAGTVAGGHGRATTFQKELRKAWEEESKETGANKKGLEGSEALAAYDKKRNEIFEDLFCDPKGNGGTNTCNTDPANAKYYNADTKATKFIYNQLTIDIGADDGKMQKTIQVINDNLVGGSAGDPIPKSALNTPTGRDIFLDRRSYLARHMAIRSVPQLITSWRLPGSKIGDFVKKIREASNTHASEISANPSYREVMHAVSVDRFNSGDYATRLLGEANTVEMEKVILNSFYLMQLRDYYELLERTALVLAVQVSVLIDQAPMPDLSNVVPLTDGF